MRTTMTIDDDLLAEVKVVAARRGVSTSSVVEAALREQLARLAGNSAANPLELPVWGDAADAPLVDLLDREALAAALDDGRLR